MSPEASPYDVFVSYNTRDHREVEAIARALEARGLRPFLDRWYLTPGLSWTSTLEQALTRCRAVAVIIGPSGMSPWQLRETGLAFDRQAKDPSLLVISVLLPGCEPPLGFLKLNMWVDLRDDIADANALDVLAAGVRGELPGSEGSARHRRVVADACPYRGLRPFREEDAELFCGRETYTQTLVEAVERRSLVAVVGASGSGKSSVVRAGLIPKLRKRTRNGTWEIVTMVPGDRPFYALATALAPLLGAEGTPVDQLAAMAKLANNLSEGSISLLDVVGSVLKRQAGTDRLLLLVDQWEELYTLCGDARERNAFVREILDASKRPPLVVVATLRGDFFGHVLGDRELADRMQGAVINLGPMTREELERSITVPAEIVGFQFEPGLVAKLLDDAGGEPGNLALLQFVLASLWDQRRGHVLLHEAYSAVGGITGAIAHQAEGVFSRLNESERVIARRVLVGMVGLQDGAAGIRQRLWLGKSDEQAWVVVRKLADARLVVTEYDQAAACEYVELGHEALLQVWARLRGWIDDDRNFLVSRTRLALLAEIWKQRDREPGLLLRGGPLLSEGEDLLLKRRGDLGGLLLEFLEASLATDAYKNCPEPPSELVDSIRRGDCVVFAGSGLAARAGVPIWKDMILQLLEAAVSLGSLSEAEARPHRAALLAGEVESVADYLSAEIGAENLSRFLRGLGLTGLELPQSHKLLGELRLAGAISFGYDDLVERSFSGREVVASIPAEADRLKEAMAQKRPFVLYMNGRPDHPESIFLSPAEYQTKTARSLAYRQFLDGLAYSKSILFVGASLETILGFARDFPVGNRRHYALVSVGGNAWKSKVHTLSRRYGIEVLPYSMTPMHELVDEFLERLVDRVSRHRLTQVEPTGVFLRRVLLENIGAFERLELEFSRPWRVLLGDNGVGKSSILRAIAVGLAGQEAMPHATNLIRVGQPSGRITLGTSRNPAGYVTEIIRQETMAPMIKSVTARLLDAEPVLVLGFPPLRIVDDRRATGPQSMGQIRPTADDVLPILQRAADPRTDQLKQWIVNLEALVRRDPIRQWSRILSRFFNIAKELTAGVDIDRRPVAENYEVMVAAGGVDLPISALSQGTTSLLSWVGLLIQRLYQINGFSFDALEQPALVLIDELDAHMHPAWQQSLVQKLKAIFPAVQFVVSTHSPLIVGGLDAEEVARFIRRGSKIEQLSMNADMLRGRTDQILTGELFDLQTTLDVETQNVIREYLALVRAANLSPADQLRLQVLAAKLQGRIPATPETPLPRRARELSMQVLEAVALLRMQKAIPWTSLSELGSLASAVAEMTREVVTPCE